MFRFATVEIGASEKRKKNDADGAGTDIFRIFVFMEKTNTCNVAVIGGGAAGYFAAIKAKERFPLASVDIYERAQKVLAKVAITGGGRCNLTNSFDDVTDLRQVYPRGHQLMRRLFARFDYRDTYEWFERQGVQLVTQDDGCVFPRSQDAMSVVRCLTFRARQLGVRVHTGRRLVGLEKNGDDDSFVLSFQDGTKCEASKVVITTGGSPRADGLAFLERLGHKIELPVPSLFTFNVNDRRFCELMGTVVDPVVMSIPSTKYSSEGALLITHWGMSGPATLKLSSHAARYLHEHGYDETVRVNWTGRRKQQEVEEELRSIMSEHPQRQLGSVRPLGLPARLWLYLCSKTGLVPEKKWAEVGKKGLNRLVETLVNDPYRISGRGTYKEEFVTCGGISLQSVSPNTLESKSCPGLYFAGEVLDIDAVTGGFNLQAAWTTGFIVGESVSL